MSAKSFKFISPGIFLNEIDNSELPAEPRDIGPLVIGRTTRGPTMRPVTVDSFEEFVQIFGAPDPGNEGSDLWRNGNFLSPTYASYAAQAWLKNSPTITICRLCGKGHPEATRGDGGDPGWCVTAPPACPGSDSVSTAECPVFEAGDPTINGPWIETTNHGGAYGLWVFDSEMTKSLPTWTPDRSKGVLAAVWYLEPPDDSSAVFIGLKGVSAATQSAGACANETFAIAKFVATDANSDFTAVITGSNYKKEITFSLVEGDKNYIRDVFNTNPTLTNAAITPSTPSDNTERYWLGETYTNELVDGINYITTGYDNPVPTGACTSEAPGQGSYIGVILALNDSTPDVCTTFSVRHGDRCRPCTDPQTGWYFCQDVEAHGDYDPRNMTKLFKFIALGHGEWLQNNTKITIENIRKPENKHVKYGSFDVVLRSISDTDKAMVIIERFSNCNLDPSSPDFIGNKIGTEFYTFDTVKRRLVQQGAFPNKSKYIRVIMNPALESPQAPKDLLPYGVFGPTKYRDFNYDIGDDDGPKQILTSSLANTLIAGNAYTAPFGSITDAGTGSTSPFQVGKGGAAFAVGSNKTCGVLNFSGTLKPVGADSYDIEGNFVLLSAGTGTVLTFKHPRVRLRKNADQDNLPVYTQASWGVWTGISDTNSRYNTDLLDLVRAPGEPLDPFDISATDAHLEHQYVFTLDDIYWEAANNRYAYEVGRRLAGSSITALSGVAATLDANISVNSFTTLFHGGFDGWDITEMDPLRNTGMPSTATEKTNYAFNTIKEGIDIVKDPEFVEYNLIAIPNLTQPTLTTLLMQTCEARADALAIIDLEGDFQPIAEGANVPGIGGVVLPVVDTTINDLKDRGLNTSYGCAYYPYVQIRDTLTGDLVYMPPSIAAIGAMAYTDRVKAPWFAPAGFNRGGLSSGIAGLPVFNVTSKLTSKERDRLYDANINPIASFPNEGIVIFGQKTLQVTRSALDRVNVRRLLLFVKKGISRIAKDILFEPNVQETWDRFISRAEPFLADVKARFGVTDYKLVLDKSTTTPALVDQNIMYAKIFLKPARAIEFIAVDFVITNTGAAFED
jgi:hypothetical protein